MPTKTTARHERSLNLEDLWFKTVANNQLIQFSLVTELPTSTRNSVMDY